MWKKILATVHPLGAIYEEKPVLSMELNKKDLDKCNGSPTCLFPKFSCSKKIVDAVRKTIGTDNMEIRKTYGISPFIFNKEGERFSVKDLLEKFGEAGWPGYDCDLEGIIIHKGIGRFGKEVYGLSVMTTLGNERITIKGIEVYPDRVAN